MVAEMTRKAVRSDLPARADDGSITTIKCYKRLARMVSQLAALRDQNQQDILLRYSKQIEDDLSTELAKRQAELRGPRKVSE